MILNVRGTSGSGKTTFVREIMELYQGQRLKFKVEGRRQPIGYGLNRIPSDPGKPLAVIGHYETACGGCDTISTGYESIFERIKAAADEGYDVLFEGLLLTAEVKWTSKTVKEGYPITVISLTTPLQQCLDNVNKRRKARNKDLPPVNPKNTELKHRGAANCNRRLREAGIEVHELSYEEAVKFAIKELNLAPGK